ncbi:uncharacterized protein CTRU02_215800 [Colletotrichum truncatum]|uniref:Uncharacterized protein n=1 Tax=Colletotrichum truncatum TaxID=5467 RepID=A0ACC3YBP6_COLTU
MSDSRSESDSASHESEYSPPDCHSIIFTISLPYYVENSDDEDSEQWNEEKGPGQRQFLPRRRDSQRLNLCFHRDWHPTVSTLELHFSDKGIQTSFSGRPPLHKEDTRILTLECNRILIAAGLYFAAVTLIMIAVEVYVYYDVSVLRSMEERWREIPLSAELSRIALLYGNAASSVVNLTESTGLVLSDLMDKMVPLCRHADLLPHNIRTVCDEYDAILTEAVGSHARLQSQASSWTLAGAQDGSRLKDLLFCWHDIRSVDHDDGADEPDADAVFSCVTKLLRRWRDTDSGVIFSRAGDHARELECQLRDMRSRQGWIIDPFERFIQGGSNRSEPRVFLQTISSLLTAVKKKTEPELDALIDKMEVLQEAMDSARTEGAMLEAELLALHAVGWVTWPMGHAVLSKFPAIDRMVADLDQTIGVLERNKA